MRNPPGAAACSSTSSSTSRHVSARRAHLPRSAWRVHTHPQHAPSASHPDRHHGRCAPRARSWISRAQMLALDAAGCVPRAAASRQAGEWRRAPTPLATRAHASCTCGVQVITIRSAAMARRSGRRIGLRARGHLPGKVHRTTYDPAPTPHAQLRRLRAPLPIHAGARPAHSHNSTPWARMAAG